MTDYGDEYNRSYLNKHNDYRVVVSSTIETKARHGNSSKA